MTAPAQPAPVLTDAQRETHAQVFGDALAYRLPDTCRDCAQGQQCGDHDEDMRRRHAYEDLAAELSITPEA